MLFYDYVCFVRANELTDLYGDLKGLVIIINSPQVVQARETTYLLLPVNGLAGVLILDRSGLPVAVLIR